MRKQGLWPIVAATLSMLGTTQVYAQSIRTYAGGGHFVNALAKSIAVANPAATAIAPDGTLYIAGPSSIVHYDPVAGTASVIAGSGTTGFSGDGGPASAAQLSNPAGVAVDTAGNLYISDTDNNRIRRIDASTGVITTVAGRGSRGYSGDGGPAIAAQLFVAYGVAVDAAGNLYVADTNNNRIRRIDASTGVITTVAGSGTRGFSGDGGPAIAAQLYDPFGIAVDAGGNLYIADTDNNRVRRVDAGTGIITTLAGNGTTGYSGDGFAAPFAQLANPTGVAVDAAGNLYITDEANQRIRRVDAETSIITTVAGTGTTGYSGDGGPASAAQLYEPNGVAVDTGGNLYIADTYNERIRRVDAVTGVITSAVGNGTYSYSGDGFAANTAQLATPSGVAVDAAGNLYIADEANQRIRRVDAETSIIATVAGTGIPGYSGDGGPASAAELNGAIGVGVDAAGNLYIADTNNNCVRRVDAKSGIITTVAGNGTHGFSGDGGPAIAAQLADPEGVAFDAVGNLYIPDTANHRIRRVDVSTGSITTVAGNGAFGFGGDGGPATAAQLYDPVGVGVDAIGNLYIADTYNGRIRRVDASTGIITTVAGNGNSGAGGDGGPATAAALSTPYGVAIDAAGNLYIADLNNERIRRVDAASGIISTVAGTGIYGYSGDGGPAGSAELAYPNAVTTDANGNLFIADSGNGRVREVVGGAAASTPTYSLAPASVAFGNQVRGATSAPQTLTLTNTGVVSVPLTSISVTGLNLSQFLQTNNCGTSIAVGSSCAIQVVFKPTAGGAKTATLLVSASGGAAAQSAVLTGIGVISRFTLAPSSLAFGFQALGHPSTAQTVTLTNTGATALAISNIVSSNPHLFPQTNNCGTSVAVGASCTFQISFEPSVIGAANATLTVRFDGGAGSQRVSLSGTGAVAGYTLGPSSLDFGNQTRGTASAAQSITLTNTGGLPLAVASIVSSNPAQFPQTNTCGTAVVVGGSCAIQVTFTPSIVGSTTATLTVKVSGGAGSKTVALSGAGAVPSYLLTPTSLSFGTQPRGTTSAAQTITLANTGSVPLSITKISTGSPNPQQFMETNNCGASLGAGASCTIQMAFSPSSVGTKSTVVTVTTAGGAGNQTSTVSGTGS